MFHHFPLKSLISLQKPTANVNLFVTHAKNGSSKNRHLRNTNEFTPDKDVWVKQKKNKNNFSLSFSRTNQFQSSNITTIITLFQLIHVRNVVAHFEILQVLHVMSNVVLHICTKPGRMDHLSVRIVIALIR